MRGEKRVEWKRERQRFSFIHSFKKFCVPRERAKEIGKIQQNNLLL